MEINQINNTNLKMFFANKVVDFLLDNKLIEENWLKNLKIEFGYIFTKIDGEIEALLKVISNEKEFYFAIQNNSIKYIIINDQQYKETIDYMKENHECLRSITIYESETQKNRRLKNNNYLIQNNITINENLLCCANDSDVKLKNIDDICKRAIACLITTQIACDINNGMYDESIKYFLPMYKEFDVENYLNSKEKRIVDGTYNMQDAIDMDWAYEAYWSVCWCLGLVEDIKDASQLCDCKKAISFVTYCKSFDEFKNQCKLRSVEEILDMLDLYYRYNWAINNKKIDDMTNIGNLNESNVIERRRGLEWIISSEYDWYALSLNA